MMEQETAVLNYAVLLFFCFNFCLPDQHCVMESGVFNKR